MNHNTKKQNFLITFYLLITSTIVSAQDQIAFADQPQDNQNVDIGELLSLVERPDDIEPFLSNFYQTQPHHEITDQNFDSLNSPLNENENEPIPMEFLNSDYQLDSSITENDLLNALLGDLTQNLDNPAPENEVSDPASQEVYPGEQVPFVPIEQRPEPIFFKFAEPLTNVENLAPNLSSHKPTMPPSNHSVRSTKFGNLEKNTTNTTAGVQTTKFYANSTSSKNDHSASADKQIVNSTAATSNSTLLPANLSTTGYPRNTTTNLSTPKNAKSHSFILNDLKKNKKLNLNANDNLKGYFNIQSFDEIYDIDSLPGQKPSLIGKGGHVVEKRVHMDPMAKGLSTKGR
ncbi:hypothetical protein BpHYR1_036640 [Brachionus plicatilis]|uniref:Uncharacterized protein n=1 Tax=Brachionus plicatilis TaxID=10195 RepID=A0A3M7SNJ2_BRAPC|nr:hypothetical protein BpHYR1_036640 [Brachionus plicatilis]